MNTQFWVIQAFNGISYGALLFLVGSGLSLIFGVMRIVNLSHGAYFLCGGADVTFIVEDDQGKPDASVTKAKKLVLQDKVDMFIGGLLASSGYAMAPVSTSDKTLYIASVAAADD